MRLDSLREVDAAHGSGVVQGPHGPLVIPQLSRVAAQPKPSTFSGIGRALFSKGALLLALIVIAWEFMAEPTKKPSYLVGSVTGSMNAAATAAVANERAAMEGKVEQAKQEAALSEQTRFMPVLEAYKLAYQNCAVQTQALAQAQSQMMSARTALASNSVNSRMSMSNLANMLGTLADAGSPGAGYDLKRYAQDEADSALAEFDRRAGSPAPALNIIGSVCGESPDALMRRLGIRAP